INFCDLGTGRRGVLYRCVGCDVGNSRRGFAIANFLTQLALFTARHRLYAFFLLNILLRLDLRQRLVAVKHFGFLLCLALIVVTTTVALTAGLLLLVTGFGFIRIFDRGNRLAIFTCFSVLRLFLTTITTIVFAAFTIVTRFTVVATFAVVVALVAIAIIAVIATVVTIVTVTTIVLAWFTTIL